MIPQAKINQIIEEIVDNSSYSFVDKKIDCIRFCISIHEDKKETIENAVAPLGLKQSDLLNLEKLRIIHNFYIDDYTLHIRIKKSFLTKEQCKEAEKEYAKSLKEEKLRKQQEKKEKHDAKCIAMYDELVKALRDISGIEAWISDRKMKEHFQKTVYSILKKAEQK